jgi:Rrf2 family protein
MGTKYFIANWTTIIYYGHHRSVMSIIVRREEGHMQFSKSTDYALHALLHLGHSERHNNVGIKELSLSLGVSESYLSKIMSKLRQDGIVRAVPGVNGGYELAKPAEQITFLDVIQVIEGRQQMFECSNSRSQQHTLLSEEGAILENHEHERKSECLVEKVMVGAEEHLHQYLRDHTIQSVLDESAKRHKHVGNKK